jgi:CHAT domain-containing protein/Tfp pilus assembly protein PilF
LASLHHSRGDYELAEPPYVQALKIREDALGLSHPHVAQSLDGLAALYLARKESARAEPLYDRAVAVREDAFGWEDPEVARSMDRLAALHLARGNIGQAEQLYDRALSIREKALGAWSPEVAESLENLALLYHAQGTDDLAVPLLERSLKIEERVLGAKHPNVARTLMRLALVRRSLKAGPGRLGPLLRRAGEIQERELKLVLAIGSEKQKLEAGERFARETSLLLSHLTAFPADDSFAARLALTTVLRRKGRVLDATAESLAVLRERLDPEDRSLLEELNDARARLASRTFRGVPGDELVKQLQELDDEVEQLETSLSSRSAEFRVKHRPITLERVQTRIPEDAALVEIALYEPFRFEERGLGETWGGPLYAAFVLKNEGDPIRLDLGRADELDRLAKELREAVSDPSRDARGPARALDEALMGPIRPLIAGVRHLLVSPDGALNLIPFAALLSEEGKFSVEERTISFLTSGRDLLRLDEDRSEAREGPWVVANPDFDAGGEATALPVQSRPATGSRRSRDLTGIKFRSLPGTDEEAKAIQELVANVSLRTGALATEGVLKERRGPQLLHIATHGFFLSDQFSPHAAGRGLESVAPARPELAVAPLAYENPLLRSGLVFAGANRSADESGDGLLTALEVSGLDLWGAELVVLSACETGLGDVRRGEGVFGLRRALVVAGSESQVMSLWKVSDQATKELMVAYYERLVTGEGRSEALRQAQLEMLASEEHGHPFYWASFIHSGEWRPLRWSKSR